MEAGQSDQSLSKRSDQKVAAKLPRKQRPSEKGPRNVPHLCICGHRLAGPAARCRVGAGVEPAGPAAVLATLQEERRERLEDSLGAPARGRVGRHRELQLDQLRVLEHLGQDRRAQTQLLESAAKCEEGIKRTVE